jgi:hypothetical protein
MMNVMMLPTMVPDREYPRAYMAEDRTSGFPKKDRLSKIWSHMKLKWLTCALLISFAIQLPAKAECRGQFKYPDVTES